MIWLRQYCDDMALYLFVIRQWGSSSHDVSFNSDLHRCAFLSSPLFDIGSDTHPSMSTASELQSVKSSLELLVATSHDLLRFSSPFL
jgi:hypothetical protein